MQSYDNKERRRKALARRREDKKRKITNADIEAKNYRLRLRELADKTFTIETDEGE
jgi:hypothetical protein